MRQLSLRTLVLLLIIGIAFPVVLSSRFLIAKVIKDPLMHYANEKNFLLLKAVKDEIDDALSEIIRTLNTIGEIQHKAKNPFAFGSDAKQTMRGYSWIKEIFVLDREGNIRDAIPEKWRNNYAAFKSTSFFLEAKAKHISLFFDPKSELSSASEEIYLIVPYGKFFLIGSIDRLWLKMRLRKLEIIGFMHYFIVDRKGRPIIHANDDYVEKKINLGNLNCVKEGFKWRNGPFTDTYEGKEMVTYASFLTTAQWLLCIGEEKNKIYAPYENVKNSLFVTVGIAGFVAVLIGMLISPIITRGIENLSAMARRLAEGSYEVKFIKPLTKEVKDVQDSILEMIERIKDREEAMREERDRFRVMVDEAPLSIMLLDEKGKFLHVNRRFTETFGYSEEEIPDGKTWFRLAYPDEKLRAQVISHWNKYAMEKNISGSVVFPVTCKDGSLKYIEFHSVKTKNLFIIMAKDITEERETHERFQRLFNDAKDAIFFFSLDGSITDMNEAGLQIYGYESKEELIGLNILDIFKDAKDRAILLEKLERQKFVKNFETLHRRKDGSNIWVDGTITALKDEKGDVKRYVAIRRDVTEVKKLQDQFLQAQKMEIIGRLTGGIAHDFNNMLTVILGNLEMSERFIDRDHPVSKFLSRAKEAAQKSASFVKQLLAFSRRQVLDLKPLNINDVIMDLVKITRKGLREDIELSLVLSEKKLMVKADIGQMNQMLLNLIVNAVDAMEMGGKILIETHVVGISEEYTSSHPEAKEGHYVLISISDTGIGIQKDMIERIFEPFFTTKKEGTGLGLSVVYGIVKQHGGFINVYSEYGKGTTFKIYLPVMEQDFEEERIEKEIIRGGNERILVVEDDDNVRNIVETMLKRLGYTVIVAEDGEKAIEIFREKRAQIDLCILDIVMPKMGGRETFEQIKAIKEDVPVIFMTGYTENTIHVNFVMKAGLNVLHKPFSFEVLAKNVREVLDSKNA